MFKSLQIRFIPSNFWIRIIYFVGFHCNLGDEYGFILYSATNSKIKLLCFTPRSLFCHKLLDGLLFGCRPEVVSDILSFRCWRSRNSERVVRWDQVTARPSIIQGLVSQPKDVWGTAWKPSLHFWLHQSAFAEFCTWKCRHYISPIPESDVL